MKAADAGNKLLCGSGANTLGCIETVKGKILCKVKDIKAQLGSLEERLLAE